MELIITEKDSNITLQKFKSDTTKKEMIDINSGSGITQKNVFSIDHLIYDKNLSIEGVDNSDDGNKFLLGLTVGVGTIVAVAITVKIYRFCKKK